MSAFTRVFRAFRFTFPVSNITEHKPSDLADYIQPVTITPAMYERVLVGETKYTSVALAAGVANGVLVPGPTVADTVRWVRHAFVEHDQAATLVAAFHIRASNVPATLFTISSSQAHGAGTGVTILSQYPLNTDFPRGVILGPGEDLVMEIKGIGGANIVDGRAMFVDLSPAELFG